MKILFASFECLPFFKSGGLGDVAGSLPSYIKAPQYDIRVILPKLSAIPERYKAQMAFIRSFDVPLGWRKQYCGLFMMKLGGITYYFLDNEYYFRRMQVYGEFDDGERIAFFSKAVVEAIQYLPNFMPDVLHCNDWHTALSPVFLREFYRDMPGYNRIKTVFTIHNLKFQGQFSDFIFHDICGLTGTPAEHQMISGSGVNFMAGGVHYADRITTVSPSYADEICTEYYGEHMDGLFRERKPVLSGILNGIDYNEYDPEKDEFIPSTYSASDLSGKAKDKAAFQKAHGLRKSKDTPMLSIISRLTEQKGFDLVTYILPHLAERGVQLVILGVGERQYEDAFRWYAGKYPKQFCFLDTFNVSLSHEIYAASDLFIMPSRFEPCGLSQMMAMRYGTLPVVRETGGLRDSVQPYNKYTGEGTGFSFANFNAHELLACIDSAIEIYKKKPDDWNRLINNAMSADFSWTASAKKYRQLYRELTK